MQKFFYNVKEWFRRVTYGCYGQDELSRMLSRVGLVCLILSLLRVFGILYPIGFICVIWSCFRTFSKNHAKRIKERDAYYRIKGKITSFINLQKRRFKERKTHDYYKCPGCNTYNRVPKGHGRILLTCPKCKREFERG